jgi:tryptophanyl-tRNA synthetase
MLDDADTIAKKFKKAKTDAEPLPETVEGLKTRPEARNLVDIYAALDDTTPEAVIAQYLGAGWGTFKPALADLAVAKLAPISQDMARFMADPAEIDRILAQGADKARAIAQPVLQRTYDIVGLLRG